MPHTATPSSLRGVALPAALVLATMVPATIVIPVLRAFVSNAYPGREWLVHAFMAVNLLGACLLGPVLAVRADRRAQRRFFVGLLAVIDGLTLVGVALMPPVPVMLALRFVQGAASVGAVSILMGSARAQAKSSGAMGLVGGSVILAIVVAIPLGAILGRDDPTVPLLFGGGVGVAAGLVAWLTLPRGGDVQRSEVSLGALLTSYPLLRGPTLVVALERMAVGAFVVTLQLYGHHVLEVADGKVSSWFSAFLVTFALATWPMTRLGDRVERWRLVAGGALVYGAMFIALGVVAQPLIMPLLFLGGLGSAAIYGPALTLANQSVPDAARGSAMAMLNAAGTLGMFAGNVVAFGFASGLVEAGVSRGVAYPVVFVVAGVSQSVSVFVGLSNTTRGAELPSAL